MVNLKRIADQAKRTIDKRGGTASLKEDLNELKGVAKGKGTMKDKAKAAGEALKQPGTNRTPVGGTPPPQQHRP